MRSIPLWIAVFACLPMTPWFSQAADPVKLTGDYKFTPGYDNTMLLLQGNVLVRFGADGVTEKERIQLDKKYSHIAERKDYFVALSEKSVATLDKKTLKPIREKSLGYRAFTDLALHPKLPLSYAAVEFDIYAPRYRVIIFDEKTGDAHEPRGFFGTWVRVHPAGTFLITGHKDIYERGTRFFINPDSRLQSMPEYGNIDLLISYSLDDTGKPSFLDLRSKAGGNGSGIRMSPDGERITYLSAVGTPQFSGNLGGFDPLDLQKLPVEYATKDKATTDDLTFHPRLPLCASPARSTVLFFHRDDEKKPAGERLDKSVKFDNVHRAFFAPDGKNLVLDCESGGVRALRGVALKLSATELATLAKPLAVPDNSAKVAAAQKRAHGEIERKVVPVKAARDKAIDWLRLNNTFGPDHKIVVDQAATIDQELERGRNVMIVLGKDLVKANTTTYLTIWNGTFIPFPLTPAQDKAKNFPKNTLVNLPGGKVGYRLIEPRAQLLNLKFNGSDALDGKQKLTGSINYQRLDTETGNYSLRVQYVVGDSNISTFHHLGTLLPKTEEEIKFSFEPILSDGRMHSGPLPVFVELVTFATSDRSTEPAIVSNTIGQIVSLKTK